MSNFFNHVFAGWDVRESYDVIYLDVQKAFDKVLHKRRISKLRAHEIGDHLCTWIEEWLSDRQQRVFSK